MIELNNSRYYIIIKSFRELSEAKRNSLCRCIIYELRNVIYMWTLNNRKWIERLYVVTDDYKDFDYNVSGFNAYNRFYEYVGKEELNKMKSVYKNIDILESTEQMHYANIEYSNQKIYKPIYVYDCNSSFTYGALQLPKEFNKLKEYLLKLYEQKKNAKTKYDRSTYKNLQNYLIGYFARVGGLVTVRSNIIKASNINIKRKMIEIQQSGGIVYLSNTDSIVTDDIGNKVMQKYIGNEAGQFKLEAVSDRLYYKSCNNYQVGDKLKHSGVQYYANKHTDYFKDVFAEQFGSFIRGFDYIIEDDDFEFTQICKVNKSKIIVTVKNILGDIIERHIYQLEE